MISPPPSSPVTATTTQYSPANRPEKPKGKPTVTPRSFRRFFTPRVCRSNGLTSGDSRQALQDVTGSAVNRQYRVSKRRSPRKDSIKLFDEDENPELGSNNLHSGRKRAFYSPDSTPDFDDPSKRFKISDEDNRYRNGLHDGLSDTDHIEIISKRKTPKPVKRSAYRGCLGEISRREIDMPSRAEERSPNLCIPSWQSQVANFYCEESGLHTMRKEHLQESNGFSLPFCTAACNTNPLVAIGDEDGVIRILDSQNGSKSFRKPWVTFQPHTNAIIDIEFSPDDAWLATVSGDQTGQIIDMPTQKAVYELKGLEMSAKQVRFQPGSNGTVIATSTREGTIQLWDLRCKGPTDPVQGFKVPIGGPENIRATTFTNSSVVSIPACVSAIRDAHVFAAPITEMQFNPLNSFQMGHTKKTPTQSRNVSITAISFLSESSPHFLLSGSEASATVKLWDLRMKQMSRARKPAPLSSTQQPRAHSHHRTFGLTSMVVSGDASRLYTVCKDNSIYAYSLQHMILGSAPELAKTWRPRRNGGDKEGLGPLYAFRHDELKVSTFYVKSALRPSRMDRSEVLAVGSSTGSPVLFTTDERQFKRRPQLAGVLGADDPLTPAPTPKTSRPASFRTNSGIAALRSYEDISVFSHGAYLAGGHEKEVTSMVWSSDGDLVTVGDDYRCRVWRENSKRAADLRRFKGRICNRFEGWADLGSFGDDWDDDE